MPTRRHRGEGSLYKRADGMWVGTVEVHGSDGRRIRRTVSSRDKATAQRKLTELRRTIDAHGDAPRQMTVAAWLDYWLEQIAAARVKPRALQGYRTTVTQHIAPSIGRKRLGDLTPHHVRQMHRDLEAKGLAPTTVLKAHRVLAKALTDAMREGKATRNVATLLDAPRRGGSEQQALTVDQARTLLLSVKDDPLGSRWAAALLLGARQGEILGLQWDRVDLDHGLADLSWQLQRLGFRHGCETKAGGSRAPGEPKGYPCGRVRAGSCPQRVLDVPRGFEHQQLEGGLCLTRPKSREGKRVTPLSPAMWAFLRLRRDESDPGPHNLVWSRPDGRPIDPSHDNRDWHKALAAAGLPSVRLHDARHTTATLLLEQGEDAKVIGQILGHSEAVTTRGYQHVSHVMARRALDGLDQLLQQPDQIDDQTG